MHAEGLEQGVQKTVRRTVLARRVYDAFNYDTHRDKRGVSFYKMMIFCPCQTENPYKHCVYAGVPYFFKLGIRTNVPRFEAYLVFI